MVYLYEYSSTSVGVRDGFPLAGGAPTGPTREGKIRSGPTRYRVIRRIKLSSPHTVTVVLAEELSNLMKQKGKTKPNWKRKKGDHVVDPMCCSLSKLENIRGRKFCTPSYLQT